MTIGATGRLLRAYSAYCKNPDQDALFTLLTAAHSLNDQVKEATGNDFHTIPEFVALKALRNFIHHGEDVPANMRLIPSLGASDLGIMCILRRDQVEYAVEQVRGSEARRLEAKTACDDNFKWYGDAVDINPCIFNLVVKIYEHLLEADLPIPKEDAAELEASYQFEKNNGFSHYVEGNIEARAGELDAALREIIASLPPQN